MHKFSFENTYPEQLSTTVEFTVPSDADLTDMLEQFELYLKAVGFSFDGNIDIVPEHSFDDTVRGFDEYGNYGENNPPVVEPTAEKGYPSYEAVNSKKKLWDATPEEWNQAYKSVTMTYNGEPIYKGPRAK